MVERSVHLAVRGLVAGFPKEAAAPGSVASPGPRVRLGPFDLSLEAARARVLPGEENEIALLWKSDAGSPPAEMQLVLDLPAEVRAPEAQRSAKAVLGGERPSGEARFFVTGEEPGGVWVDVLLTIEDEMGAVLARAKAGFSVARHRVVISEVRAEPSVVAAGESFTVRAGFAWTGAARVRGTLGGALRRRADGAVLELHREKVSALGERSHEWQLKAPVDQVVADFDVELSFEAKEEGARAQFGKTGVLAVRRGLDAEVASVKPASTRWGVGDPGEVRVQVRNSGVRALDGAVRLEVYARPAGAAEADLVASAAAPEHQPLSIAPAGAAEAVFEVRLPKGIEGWRLEARAVATFGSLEAEKREVLGIVVAEHLLEFDGFAADRYAYGPGDEAEIECRVRDDGARPGGSIEVAVRLLDGAREVVRGAARVEMKERAATLRVKLKLPDGLETKTALDVEVAAKAFGAVRRVPGFVRVRQAVASRVIVVKPPPASGVGAFLFEGESVEREIALGDLEGHGASRLVVLDSGAFFVGGADFLPVAGPPAALERAVAKGLVKLTAPPPTLEHERAWERLAPTRDPKPGKPKRTGTKAPSQLVASVADGAGFRSLVSDAQGKLREALELTAVAIEGSRLPSTEISNRWIEAGEAAAQAGGSMGEATHALLRVRELEAAWIEKLIETGLGAADIATLAQAAVLRRSVEAEVLARGINWGAPDRVLELSVALKAQEERLRAALRFYVRFLAKVREAAEAAGREGRSRRQLASLRAADVRLEGADAIVPGRFNTVAVELRLPAAAPAGGVASAAVALPSELWIVGTETAQLLRGQYLLPGAAVAPGGKATWQLQLYVPDRAGGEPGAIEVRIGFEEDREGAGP